MNARKAIVLAAGYGTRLRPLTCSCPKPLLPVWGVPMLGRVVEWLRENGVEEIMVNCHYLAEQVIAWCKKNGCGVSHEQDAILGTGGALNPLRDWIGGDSFYLVNGDIVFEGFSGFPELDKAESDSVIGQCLVTEEGPRTIEVTPECDFVTCWKSPDPGYDTTYTYCGVALLKPAILDYVKSDGSSSIVEAYEKAMMEGKFIKTYHPEGLLWTDAGTIERYIAVNQDGDDNAFGAIPQIAAALDKLNRKDCPVRFIASRGSDRCFFGLSSDSIAVIYDDAKRPENARYASHAAFLRESGISVPSVILDMPELKTTIFENAGFVDLAQRVAKDDVGRIESYVPVVEMLAKFNNLAIPADMELESEYGIETVKYERGLFRDHCLRERYQMEMAADVEGELEKVAGVLLAEPPALMHRDFQSTNVMWKNGNPSIIDFQGMRRGPAVYDLASLLYDPYISLTHGERRALAALYAKCSSRSVVVKILPFAAVQRLVQALGAFGRLASVGHPEFLRWVLPALQNLLEVADEANLDAIGALAETLIAKELELQKRLHKDHDCTCGGHHHGEDGCHCHDGDSHGGCSCHSHSGNKSGDEGCACHHAGAEK